MPSPLRPTFAALCRTTRIQLDITQGQLAPVVGVSRAYIGAIETGRANPTLEVVERMSDALGLELDLVGRPPVVVSTRQRDLVHARCSAYVQRRLEAAGLTCLREVEIVHVRSHGWIDVMAFDMGSGTLFVIEVKTTIDDIGAVERQLAWYRRAATDVGRAHGWRVRSVRTWLLALASEEVEGSIRVNRDVLRVGFPARAPAMRRQLAGADPITDQPGLALIDPTSRRRDWLISSRLDGRRSPAPFRDYADAVVRWRAAASAGGR